MALYLSGTVGDRFAVWALDAPSIGLGRSSKNAIQLVDGTVSKEHAEIARAGHEWILRDLGSRNGTRVNGVPVREPVHLRPGDRLEIGHVPLRVTAEHPDQPTQFSDSSALRSSVKIRAEQLLGRETTKISGSTQLVHLLAEAGRLLVLPRPLKETCDEILQIVEKAVPASRLMLLLKHENDAVPVQVSARYLGGRVTDPMVLSRAIMKTVLDECTSVITTDAAEDPRFQLQQSIVSQSVHSAMAVPLFDNQRVLGILYADQNDPAISYGEEQLEVLTLVANMAAVKITNARLLEAEQEQARVRQELATATRIQRSLLPAEAPEIPGYQFQAFLETCFEVGGDLYDFHHGANDRIYFLVGDVSGKGMGAALLMSSVLASARVLYDACAEPGELVTRLSGMLHRCTDPKNFVTAFIGQLDPGSGVIRYVNAGHPPPFVLDRGALRELDSTGPPLGVVPEFPYAAQSVELSTAGMLAIFSDGIPEAQHGDEFFDSERLGQALAEATPSETLEAVSRRVIERVDAFLGEDPRGDDITLLLLRRG